MATAPTQQAPQQPQRWWKPVWDLVVEVWVGSFLFAVLFTPAVGLDLTIKWLETSWEVSAFLFWLLTLTKYTIAVLDALLYIVFMLNMAWLFMNKLRWSKNSHG